MFANLKKYIKRLKIKTKLIITVLGTTILVFISTATYVNLKYRGNAIDDAIKLAITTTKQASKSIESELNINFGTARSMQQTALQILKSKDKNKLKTLENIYYKSLEDNPTVSAVFGSFELSALDSTWTKPYGRRRIAVLRKQKELFTMIDTLDTNGDNQTGLYYANKISVNPEIIADPYLFRHKIDNQMIEELTTSIIHTIKINNIFVGDAGVDVNLAEYHEMTDKIKPYERSFAFIISNNGIFVAHPNDDFVGKTFAEVYPDIDKKYKITENIKKGNSINFRVDKSELYGDVELVIDPITTGTTGRPWAIGLIMPIDVIYATANSTINMAMAIMFFGLILLSVVIWILAHWITRPFVDTTEVIVEIEKGKIDKVKKFNIKFNDESGKMMTSINKLIDNLNDTVKFAKSIGAGNLTSKYELLSDDDVLGKALIEMQQNLINLRNTDEQRKKQDELRNWTLGGIAHFSELLRQRHKDINDFSYIIVSNLITYLEASAGCIFILNDDKKDDSFLEIAASYAYNRRKYINNQVRGGEGLIGTCMLEKKTIYITEVPDNYLQIASGLGKTDPKSIMIVPLKVDEEVFGILEIASLDDLDENKRDFVERIGEIIASTLSNLKANQRTEQLLELSRQQAEAMAAQEEEMRQNLEELQSTQDDLHRRNCEQEALKNELTKENQLLTVLLENIPERIIFKDLQSKYIRINRSQLNRFKKQTYAEVVGKSDFDFYPAEYAKKIRKEEEEIIRTGHGIIDKVEISSSGDKTWKAITKMPLTDENGKTIGTFALVKDVTEIKNMEIELRNQNEALSAQEDFMRHNLEQLQSTQEEMMFQYDVLRKTQEELKLTKEEEARKSQELLDSIELYKQTLTNIIDLIPGKIFLKDNQCKMLLVNEMVCKIHHTTKEELLGKSDFDFFPYEHALRLFNEEQDIMNTGAQTYEQTETLSGELRYLRTIKMPIYIPYLNQTGLLGYQIDITDFKKLQEEISEQNEQLVSQEEELRQNLEELQTTQEDILSQNRILKITKEELRLTKEDEAHKLQELLDSIELHKQTLTNIIDLIPGKIFLKDNECKMILVNETVCKIHHTTKEELLGKSDFDFFPYEQALPLYNEEQDILKNGTQVYEQSEMLSGELRYLKTTKMPIYIPYLNQTGILGYQIDITDYKNLENEIMQQNEKLQLAQKEANFQETHLLEVIDQLKSDNEKYVARIVEIEKKLTNNL